MERIAIISKIRLIISDIDGTILTSNHQVDDQLGMQPIAHKLGLHDNPITCYNGA